MHQGFARGIYGIVAAGVIGGIGVSGALAQGTSDLGSFSVIVKGITAGTLTYAATQDGVGYAVQGKLATSGLAAFVKQVRYDASSRGTVSDGVYTPSSYSEKADTGRRQTESVMEYVDGVPQVKVYKQAHKAKAATVDPATQGGTVDPLTAMYATLRDVKAGEECQVSLRMFDGRRSSAVTLDKPQPDGDRVTCSGEYRRVAGFSQKDMDEKTRFYFTLTYAPKGDGMMQVEEISMDTLFGRARMVRD